MTRIFLLSLLALCLVNIGNAYSVQGAWELTIDSSYQQIDPSAQVIFNFQKLIEQGKIVNRLTVYACAVITFRYTIQDDNVNFIYEKTIATKRACVKNEVGQIRRKMEKVYYTLTIANNLVFVSPSGNTVFRMKKIVEKDDRKSLAGIWNVIQAQNDPVDIITKANATTISLCQGKGLVSYQVSTKNDVRFVIQETNGCPQNKFFSAIFKSRYYRMKKQDLLFYDRDYNVVSVWSYETDHPQNGQIAQSRPVLVPVQPKPINPSPSQQVQPTSKVEQKNVDSKAPVNTNTTINTSNQNQVKQPIPVIRNPAPAPSSSPVPVPSPAPVPVIRNPVPPVLVPVKIDDTAYINPISEQTVLKKWYGVTDGNNGKIMIITPARIMIYGSCGVYYSTFNFGKKEGPKLYVEGISVKNTSPNCLVESDDLATALSNSSYLQAQKQSAQKTILSFFSKQDKKVLSLSTEPLK